MFKFWSVLALLSLMAMAPAQALTPKEFVLLQLEQIQQKGLHEVNGLSIEQLKKDFSDIKVVSYNLPIFLIGSGNREGAVNLVEQKTAYFNLQTVAGNSGPENSLLFTHEFLGAAGYIDDHYSISSVLYNLQQSPNPVQTYEKTFKNLPNVTKKRTQNIHYKRENKSGGGTVTGVGGGGDPLAALAKYYLIKLFFPFLDKLELEGLDQTTTKEYLLNRPIEIERDQENIFVIHNDKGLLDRSATLQYSHWKRLVQDTSPEGELRKLKLISDLGFALLEPQKD